jgi:hypothetical protein
MNKSLFSAIAVGLCMTAHVMAQVPSYVPTSGLVGWWPFNGNANDESGNGNNGTVNGATLTTDRFGVANKAYSFDGVNDFISINHNTILNFPNQGNSFSFAVWVKPNQTNLQELNILSKGTGYGTNSNDVYIFSIYNQNKIGLELANFPNAFWTVSVSSITFNQWNHFAVVYDFSTNNANFYINGTFAGQQSYPFIPSSNGDINQLFFGKQGYLCNCNFMNGLMDDFGLWNRALTQQEITTLYNGCAGNGITVQPSNASVNVGTNAQFTINTASGSTYQWQSNPLNTGWVSLINNSTYSGVTSNTMTVTNTTVSNHNQPFRAIVNAGGCIDTSDVAQIIIGDTCLTTVTDTLIINTTLSLPAPNNENTILIYPNPASDHITIDNGNFAAMAGYSIKIENNAGQQVFQSLINQAQFYVDLSTWTGNGLYFVHLIDAQGNTVTVRKIVLQ